MLVSASANLAFAHFPKTAGTSLSDLIRRRLPDATLLDPRDSHVGVAEGLRRLRLRNRPVAWAVRRALGQRRARCATRVENPGELRVLGVIREPFQMAVSLYEFWGRSLRPEDMDHALPAAAARGDFKGFLRELAENPHGFPSYDRFYDVGGPLWPRTLLVDMDHLESGLAKAFGRLGLDIDPAELARLNVAPQGQRAGRAAREAEAGELADRVRERFGWYYGEGLRLALR